MPLLSVCLSFFLFDFFVFDFQLIYCISVANSFYPIRSEVLKERHSTAKKLRKYYLQCLKQLLEEDHVALEGNTSPSSNEDKLNRMAEALRTFSPERESSGELCSLILHVSLIGYYCIIFIHKSWNIG